MTDTALIIFILLSVLGTSFISGVFGMAGGMILMGIYTWLLPVPVAMMLHGITQLTSNGARWILHRPHILWRTFLIYGAGALICLAGFTTIRWIPEKSLIFLALGGLPFIHFMLAKRIALDISNKLVALGCGVFITALQLTAGVSGPILNVFFVTSPFTRHEVVATKAITQSFGHLLKLFYFGGMIGFMDGMASDTTIPVWVYGAVMPCAILGTALARRFLDGMSDEGFRKWTQRIVLSTGGVYLVKGLMMITP